MRNSQPKPAKRCPPYLEKRQWQFHDRYYHFWTISRAGFLRAIARIDKALAKKGI